MAKRRRRTPFRAIFVGHLGLSCCTRSSARDFRFDPSAPWAQWNPVGKGLKLTWSSVTSNFFSTSVKFPQQWEAPVEGSYSWSTFSAFTENGATWTMTANQMAELKLITPPFLWGPANRERRESKLPERSVTANLWLHKFGNRWRFQWNGNIL